MDSDTRMSHRFYKYYGTIGQKLFTNPSDHDYSLWMEWNEGVARYTERELASLAKDGKMYTPLAESGKTMNGTLPFHELSGYPDHVSAGSIAARLLDGLGHRFYGATENLAANDYSYCPCSGAKSLGEMVEHIWASINWMGLHLYQEEFSKPEDMPLLRNSMLQDLMTLRNTFAAMNPEELEAIQINDQPFWHPINGPMADALTHVGQINILRRMAGNPPLKNNPFLGIAP